MLPAHVVRLSQSSKNLLRLLAATGMLLAVFGAGKLKVQATAIAGETSSQAVAAVPDSLYGVEMYNITADQGLNEMAAAGAYWIRPRGVYWSEVQPLENQAPNWGVLADLETELDNAANEGMQVIMTVRSSPVWALKTGVRQDSQPTSCGPIAQDKLDDFGVFMNQLVDRYKDQVNYWELWNEPDVDPDLVPVDNRYGCWGDEDDEFYGGGYYAEMLKVVYPQIKAADPDAQVLVGGLLLDCDPVNVCPGERSAKFLEGILQNNGGQYFDGISYHAFDYYLGELGKYFNSNWQSSWDTTGPVSIAKANHLRSLLAKEGLTDKYLLNTEASVFCSVGCDNVYETTKAYYLAQSFSSAPYSGLRANLWFSARSGYNNTDLINKDLSLRPAYYAYDFSQSKLHAAQFLGKIRQYPGVSGYEYRLNDCPSAGEFCRQWVIWSLDGSDHLIELPDIPYSIFDVDGDPQTPQLQITVSLEPIYIELPPEFRVRMPVTAREFRELQNGNFDAGTDAQRLPTSWLASSGGEVGLSYSLVSENPTAPTLDTEIPIGSYSMLLGDPDYPCSAVPKGYASVEQTFSVPDTPDGTPLSLDFLYVIYTQDEGGTAQFDRFEVYIDDGSGPVLAFWDSRPNEAPPLSCNQWYRLPGTGWNQASIDLLQPVDYRGKSITISFQNWSRFDNWFNTFTYLDEVKLSGGS